MMNRLASVAALALMPGVALSADLPARTMAAAPVLAPKAFSWTGFHAGLFVGGAYNRSQSTLTYGSLDGNGVSFAGNGAVSSTWFNSYHAGTGPSATTIDIYRQYSYYCDNDCDGDYYGYSSTSTAQRTDAFAPSQISDKSIVGAFGAELGYSIQTGSLVLGVAVDGTVFSRAQAKTWSSNGSYNRHEFLGGAVYAYVDDYSGSFRSDATGSISRDSSGSSQYAGSLQVGPRWLSTARLTAGIAEGRFLAFVSGGVAFGSVRTKVGSVYNDSNASTCRGSGELDQMWWSDDATLAAVRVECGGTATSSSTYGTDSATATQSTSAAWAATRNQTRVGYTFGGGLGFAATENVIVKLEGHYYNLGNVTTNVTGVAYTSSNGGAASTTGAASYTVRTKVDGYLGRVGVAYKF